MSESLIYARQLTGRSDEMRQLATEVRDFVQSKVGTTEFSRAWEELRRRVSERREGRKDARNRLVRLVRGYGYGD